MTAAAELVERHGGTWRGTFGHIPTPGHPAHDKGTTIRDRSDGKGIIVHCFNGDWREVRRALGLTNDNPAPDADARKKAKEARDKREREQQAIHAAAARRCARWWDAAPDADPAHAYLVRKGIEPHGARAYRDAILLPVLGPDRRIMSMQRIAPDGFKIFAKDARTKGGFLPLGPLPDDTFVIAEGFATAATIAQATGLPVLAAFTAGNMPEVARWAFGAYPARRVLVAADWDKPSKLHPDGSPGPFPHLGGPGVHFATVAAAACMGHIVRPPAPGDFNDCGLASTREAFSRWMTI